MRETDYAAEMAKKRKMNGRAIERRNLLIFTTIAYEEGYGAYLPIVDDGIDLILCRECRDGDILMKVQMKTRWSLNKKYEGRDIWIAFPYPPKPKLDEAQVWYLARHDELIQLARELDSGFKFYTDNGEFSRGTLSKILLARMERFIFPEPRGSEVRSETAPGGVAA